MNAVECTYLIAAYGCFALGLMQAGTDTELWKWLLGALATALTSLFAWLFKRQEAALDFAEKSRQAAVDQAANVASILAELSGAINLMGERISGSVREQGETMREALTQLKDTRAELADWREKAISAEAALAEARREPKRR